jgi:hypothetical protein
VAGWATGLLAADDAHDAAEVAACVVGVLGALASSGVLDCDTMAIVGHQLESQPSTKACRPGLRAFKGSARGVGGDEDLTWERFRDFCDVNVQELGFCPGSKGYRRGAWRC